MWGVVVILINEKGFYWEREISEFERTYDMPSLQMKSNNMCSINLFLSKLNFQKATKKLI